MKKFKSLSLILIISMLSFNLCACDQYDTHFENDHFRGAKSSKDAYISEFIWYGDTMEITIPDELDGLPVTALGGVYGNGTTEFFFIDDVQRADYDYYTPPAEYTSMNDKILSCDEIVYLDFTLNIGPNLKKFNFSGKPFAYDLREKDGKTTAYVYRFYINCSEDSLWYISENGILYDSTSHARIDSFYYWDQSVK